jgi:cytochrome c553
MKTLALVLSAAVLAFSLPALATGDAVAGKQKAMVCVACHGNDSFGGMFYTLQLAGRNADRLAVKTNKYRSLKILHPLMNMTTLSLRDQDVEDISAYYQSLGKPAVTSPFFQIKGDDDSQSLLPVTQSYLGTK